MNKIKIEDESLIIETPPLELFNEDTNEFITIKPQSLTLKHSLVSVSKWEAKWQVPFLSNTNMTREQTLDYIRCMTITQNVDEEIYKNLDSETLNAISSYIDNPMTATWFTDQKGGKSRPGRQDIVTSELIYFWMYSYHIPDKWEKRHLNRLLTLINVFNIKNTPPKKMSKNEILSRQAALNEARRKALNTTG